MKTNQQTEQELDELLHPELCITKWDRFKFWFLNLDLRAAEVIGRTKRLFVKIKEILYKKNK